MITESPTTYRLVMFGGMRMLGPGGNIQHLGPQTGALIGLLTLSADCRLRRDEIACALWPDSDEETARHRLRQRLYVIKREAGDLIAVDSGEVSLFRGLLSSDVQDFEAFVKQSDSAGNDAERLKILKQAIELYTGPFLAGYELEKFRAERLRLEDAYHEVLRELALAQSRLGKHGEAIETAKRLVNEDHLAEESYWLLIETLAAAGRSTDVERGFKALCRMLQDELGVSPTEEMRARKESLKDQAAQVQPGPDPAQVSQPSDPTRRFGLAVALTLTLVACLAAIVWLIATKLSQPSLTAVPLTRQSFAMNYHEEPYGKGFLGPVTQQGALRLMDGHLGAASSAWLRTKVSLKGLLAHFRFRVANPLGNPNRLADGFAFVLQGQGPNALGSSGGQLGFGGIPKSIGLKLDLFGGDNRLDPATRTWGWLSDGQMADGTVLPLDIGNGDVYDVSIEASQGRMTAKITDDGSGASASISCDLDAADEIGSQTAWAGFTAGTGMGWCQIDVSYLAVTVPTR
jgi:DNA-binding SARP family transcriptional activator